MLNWALILIVIPFVLGWLGEVLKKTVLGEKPYDRAKFKWWQKVYFATVPWHPVVAAGPLGAAFDAFGWPDVFGDNTLAHYLAALFSSGVSIIGYQLIVRTIRRMIGAAGNVVGRSPRSEPKSEEASDEDASDGSTSDRP